MFGLNLLLHCYALACGENMGSILSGKGCCCFYVAVSYVPTSLTLLPCHLSQLPNLQPHIGLIPSCPHPLEVHRRYQIAGGLPSEGDTALLPSHFSGVQRCLFRFNIRRTPPTMPPTDNNVSYVSNVNNVSYSPPESRPPLCPSTNPPT